jgi:DNA processing protein
VALSAVAGLGPSRFRRLLDVYGSASAAMAEDPGTLSQVLSLPASSVGDLARLPSQLDAIAEELSSLDEQGVRALIWEDETYPQRLLATSSPPVVLWRVGRADLNSSPMVAVIGSRELSAEGSALARGLSTALAQAGAVVVSGLAPGIDAAAHQAALEAGAVTVGVCGCGLMTALIEGRGGLAARVAEAGALCSELSPTAPLFPQALFARDRIIAGLSDAVAVVEARAGGGAVHTAKCALREGRPVFAALWPAHHPGAAGPAELRAQGAHPLAHPADLLAALR